MRIKNQKAITLTSLVIYIIVMIMVIGVMASVSQMFHNNTHNLNSETKGMVEFYNFNNYFIKEIKTANNKIDQISPEKNYILFSTGNVFILKNKSIFYNDLQIAKNVKNLSFDYGKDEKGNTVDDVITVNIEFSNYQKQMNYKIEGIY